MALACARLRARSSLASPSNKPPLPGSDPTLALAGWCVALVPACARRNGTRSRAAAGSAALLVVVGHSAAGAVGDA
jgi:hypothetical protein